MISGGTRKFTHTTAFHPTKIVDLGSPVHAAHWRERIEAEERAANAHRPITLVPSLIGHPQSLESPPARAAKVREDARQEVAVAAAQQQVQQGNFGRTLNASPSEGRLSRPQGSSPLAPLDNRTLAHSRSEIGLRQPTGAQVQIQNSIGARFAAEHQYRQNQLQYQQQLQQPHDSYERQYFEAQLSQQQQQPPQGVYPQEYLPLAQAPNDIQQQQQQWQQHVAAQLQQQQQVQSASAFTGTVGDEAAEAGAHVPTDQQQAEEEQAQALAAEQQYQDEQQYYMQQQPQPLSPQSRQLYYMQQQAQLPSHLQQQLSPQQQYEREQAARQRDAYQQQVSISRQLLPLLGAPGHGSQQPQAFLSWAPPSGEKLNVARRNPVALNPLNSSTNNPLYHAGQTSSHADRSKPVSHVLHTAGGWTEPAVDYKVQRAFRGNTESRDNFKPPAPVLYHQNNRGMTMYSQTKLPILAHVSTTNTIY
jgi:hypothetical protein